MGGRRVHYIEGLCLRNGIAICKRKASLVAYILMDDKAVGEIRGSRRSVVVSLRRCR